jgi:putative transposase
MTDSRVEKHIIKNTDKHYNLLMDFCFKSKNLYNHGLYVLRQAFITDHKIISYYKLDPMLRDDLEYPDYKSMPTAQSAQQTLRKLCSDFQSFLASAKDYNKNPNKYTGKPKLPRYKAKDSKYELILTNQEVKLRDDKLVFPKVFQGLTIKPLCTSKKDFHSFQQVRVIPNHNHLVVEVVYNITISGDIIKSNNYLGIDLGVNNLLTITNNFNKQPVILNGKGLKSINQYYNKLNSHYQEISKRMNNKYSTRRLQRIVTKRNNKVLDFMHKSSRYLVDYAVENNVSKIIIGYNKGWKQNIELGKKTNQKFVQIPYLLLIKLITYKAKQVGIEVIKHEESYTSGTSVLDNELPIKEHYNISRRKYRGLFISNENIPINSDVNASYQIIKKVFPEVLTKGIEGLLLNPIKVNLNI